MASGENEKNRFTGYTRNLRDHQEDTLVVYKLDRLGRTTKQLVNLIEELKERGIGFHSISDNIDTSSLHGKMIFTIMAAFAELEAGLISERTKAGLKSARARGRFGGRTPTEKGVIDHAISLYDTEKYTVKKIEELSGISKTKLYQELRKRKKGVEAND